MSSRLRVDWTACRGRGTCVELLPERLAADEWGYPVVDPAPCDGEILRLARAAVRACPTRALRLVDAPPPPGGRAGRRL